MKKWTKTVALITVFALAFSLMACSSNGGSSNPVAPESAAAGDETQIDSTVIDDTIVCALIAEPDKLDPQSTTNHRSRQVDINLYESLLQENENGELEGRLAEKWEISEDALTYTFYLRPNVQFHNGETLKASDVVFTFQRGMESAFVKQFYPNVAEVNALDDTTVEVKLSSPVSFFEVLLAQPQTAIVSEKAIIDGGEEYGRNPNGGTGPYQFASWTSGSSIKLTAFEGYWGEPAKVPNCEYRIVSDATTGIIALEKGEIDFFIEMAAAEQETCEANENLAWEAGPATSYEHIVINNENEKLKDVNLRKALAYAVDKEAVLIVATNGSGTIADSQVSPAMSLYPESVKGYPRDVEKAKEHLAMSAYPDGLTLSIQVNSGYREKIAQVLQANFKEIGVELDIQVLEFNTVTSNLMSGDFELSMIGRNFHLTNPIMAVDNNFNSKYSGNGGNYQRYQNPEVDDVLNGLFTEFDAAKQATMMEEVMVALHDDVANIPLYWVSWSIAYNNNLKNVKHKPSSYYEIANFSW